MAKRKIGEVLWLALQCAKEDRQALATAYDMDKSEKAVRKALSDVAAFEALQIRLFGTDKSEAEAMIDKMTPKSIMRVLTGEIEIEDWAKEP